MGKFERLDVVETGRRRRWSEDEKLRIVAESFSGPRLVSATARRYGISPSLLYTWRRAFRAERIGAEGSAPGFVPAMIIPETRPGSGDFSDRAHGDRHREGAPHHRRCRR